MSDMLRGLEEDHILPAATRWDLIAETILAANASRVEIPNLDLSYHKVYKLVVMMRNMAAANIYLNMYFNDDEVDANYHSSYIRGGSTPLITGNFNRSTIETVTFGDQAVATLTIQRSIQGYITWIGKSVKDRAASIWISLIGGTHNVVQANLTKITIFTRNIATGLEIVALEAGSEIKIFGYRG